MMEVDLQIPLLITLGFIVLAFLRLSYTPGLKASRSDTRGLELLKDWLSPEQLTSYEQRRNFDVIGSDSGTVFRIHHGTQTNVVELDNIGQPVCRWCFVPDGSLVAGDVTLTQKIALETDERGALAVANRSLAH
jgi:hypothetical protein